MNMAQFLSVLVVVLLMPFFFGGAGHLSVISISGAFLDSHNFLATSCYLIARVFYAN